jgi:Protein of unknown function (DUF2917)
MHGIPIYRLSPYSMAGTIDARNTSVKENTMDLSQRAASIQVPLSRPLRVRNGYGRRIAVLEGNVWVTQDGDPRDIVLGAGEDFLFDRTEAALVSALGGDARIVGEDGMDIGFSGRVP